MAAFGLIVNADDLGYSRARNQAIVECIRRGVVTSCSLLANGESMAHAVSLVRPYTISLGLHVNLSEGRPLVNGHRTLVDEKGVFYDKMAIRQRVERGNIAMSEVSAEVSAQLEHFVQVTGDLPSHLDGHQHVHVLPGISHAIADTMVRYGVTKIRMPSDHSLPTSTWMTEDQRHFCKSVYTHAQASASIFAAHKLRWPTHFIGLATMGDNLTLEHLRVALNSISDTSSDMKSLISATNQTTSSNVIELMVHPGYITDDVTGGCGLGADDFSRSPERQHEFNFLVGEQFQSFIANNCLNLCSYTNV